MASLVGANVNLRWDLIAWCVRRASKKVVIAIMPCKTGRLGLYLL